MSLRKIEETQVAIISKLENLSKLISEFYRLVERLVDENAATNIIHKDLMVVLRTQSDFMSNVPTLLNTLIDMLTEERITIQDSWEEIESIRNDVDSIQDTVLNLYNMVRTQFKELEPDTGDDTNDNEHEQAG